MFNFVGDVTFGKTAPIAPQVHELGQLVVSSISIPSPPTKELRLASLILRTFFETAPRWEGPDPDFLGVGRLLRSEAEGPERPIWPLVLPGCSAASAGGSGSASRRWWRAPGLGVLTFGGFLLGDRRVTRQLVEVGDDPGRHPKHAGAVERDGTVSDRAQGRGFIPTSSPRSRRSSHSRHRRRAVQLASKAGLKVGQALGRGRLRGVVRRIGSAPPLTDDTGGSRGPRPSPGVGSRLELRPVADAIWRTDGPDSWASVLAQIRSRWAPSRRSVRSVWGLAPA